MKSEYNIGYLIFLSVVAALGGFLFGYDTAVISGTISQVSAKFNLTAMSEGWYVGCALLGSILGVLGAGMMGDKFGRKNTMIISAVLCSASAIGFALSPNFDMLVVYRIIGGMGIGVASIICPLYISELAVAQYRGRLVSLYQLAITVGFLAAYFVNYGLLDYSQSNAHLTGVLGMVFVIDAWSGLLGMETVPALTSFIIFFFIAVSPSRLISK